MLVNGEAGKTFPEIIYFILFSTYVIQQWNLSQARILDFWSFSLIFQSMDNSYQFGFISTIIFRFVTRV